MIDRPTGSELAEAVRHFLETEIAPTLSDHRLRFRTLVAMNALGILERELELGPALLRAEVERLAALLDEEAEPPDDVGALQARALELNRELARRIRAGEAPDGVLAHLRRSAEAKLQVSSPRYLGRYE